MKTSYEVKQLQFASTESINSSNLFNLLKLKSKAPHLPTSK